MHFCVGKTMRKIKSIILLFIDKPLIIRAEPLFKPEMVKIHLMKSIATIGEVVNIEVQINSGLERVRCVHCLL
jgi:hypothetical protein